MAVAFCVVKLSILVVPSELNVTVATTPLTFVVNIPVEEENELAKVVLESIADSAACLSSPVAWSLTITILSPAVPLATVPKYVLPRTFNLAIVVVAKVVVALKVIKELTVVTPTMVVLPLKVVSGILLKLTVEADDTGIYIGIDETWLPTLTVFSPVSPFSPFSPRGPAGPGIYCTTTFELLFIGTWLLALLGLDFILGNRLFAFSGIVLEAEI